MRDISRRRRPHRQPVKVTSPMTIAVNDRSLDILTTMCAAPAEH